MNRRGKCPLLIPSRPPLPLPLVRVRVWVTTKQGQDYVVITTPPWFVGTLSGDAGEAGGKKSESFSVSSRPEKKEFRAEKKTGRGASTWLGGRAPLAILHTKGGEKKSA